MTMGITFFLSQGLAPHAVYSHASNNWHTIGYGFIFLTVLMLYLEQSKELFSKVSWSVSNTYTAFCG